MITGITFTAAYIIYFKFVRPDLNHAEHWWFGVSPEGIGTLGMVINLCVALVVSRLTPPPPPQIQDFVEEIRIPRGSGPSHEIGA
jgi:cation/acetate symporter